MERNGFELVETGDWDEIAVFCRTLSDVLKGRVSDPTIDRFETWRPRAEETAGELREKTAEDESLQETRIEQESEGAAQELSAAGAEVKQGGKDMVQGQPKETVKDVGDAGNSVARGFLPPFIRLFRAIEKVLYTNIIGKTSPDYFESDEFTVALEHGLLKRDTYTIRVMCDETDILDRLEETLQERVIGDGETVSELETAPTSTSRSRAAIVYVESVVSAKSVVGGDGSCFRAFRSFRSLSASASGVVREQRLTCSSSSRSRAYTR